MSTSDADHPMPAPWVADLAVNRLLRVGLDLHRALDLVGRRRDPQAGHRIQVALGRIDDTIDDLRRAVMPG